MARRYHDPIAQVVITDKDTGDFWNWGSPTHPFLTSVNFSNDLGAVSAFSVGVDVPYDYMMSLLDINKTPFKMQNFVKARIGYASGGWTPWVEGFLQNGGKGLAASADGLAGSLEIAWMSTSAIQYTPDIELLKMGGLSRQKLLEILTEQLGFESFISDGAIENLEKTIVAEESQDASVKEGEKHFLSGYANMSVLSIVKAIVRDNDCKWWLGRKGGVFGPKTLFIYTNDEVSKGVQTTRDPFKYVIRGILQEDKGQFPCYGFDASSDGSSWIGMMSGPQAHNVDLKGLDRDSGEIMPDEAISIVDSLLPIEGVVEGGEPADVNYEGAVAEVGKGGASGTSLALPLRANGIASIKNHARNFMLQGDAGLAGTISTIGVPEEEVGQICLLLGSGAIFDSRFYIRTLTHSWTPGSWDMQLGVHRHGEKSKSGDQKETAGGQMTQ